MCNNYLKINNSGLNGGIQVFGFLCHEHPHVFRCLTSVNVFVRMYGDLTFLLKQRKVKISYNILQKKFPKNHNHVQKKCNIIILL